MSPAIVTEHISDESFDGDSRAANLSCHSQATSRRVHSRRIWSDSHERDVDSRFTIATEPADATIKLLRPPRWQQLSSSGKQIVSHFGRRYRRKIFPRSRSFGAGARLILCSLNCSPHFLRNQFAKTGSPRGNAWFVSASIPRYLIDATTNKYLQSYICVWCIVKKRKWIKSRIKGHALSRSTRHRTAKD